MNTDSRIDVKLFLDKVADEISKSAPPGTAMEREIRRITAAACEDTRRKHLKGQEAAFLNTFVLPVLFGQMRSHAALSADQARVALLNEYHRSMPELSGASPIRAVKHPFKKLMGASAHAVYRQWMNTSEGFGLTQSAPDFATREPFPHRIVFEGKYFWKGPQVTAAQELVRDLYQAFFYRGLPPLPATSRGHPEWGYEFACLVAYDASPNGTLKKAWEALDSRVRKSFWEGANIYVMILGGQGTVADA
jgi:hypothetical protein